jgi:hypothetical protein
LKTAALTLKLNLKHARLITDFESGIIKAVRKEVGRCFYSLEERIFLLFIFSLAVLYIKDVFSIFCNALTKN